VVNLEIRPARSSEAKATVALALRVFDEFIAPDYPEEGVNHFYANVTPERMADAISEGEIVLVATVEGTLAGVVTVRHETHISWLYVDKAFHARGIGRELLCRAVAQIKKRSPVATMITLNASPYAVPIYVRMGFETTGPEMSKHGMRMIPMHAGIKNFI
jgi:ribosomal protein S18 acetylase RimI-like enzyme